MIYKVSWQLPSWMDSCQHIAELSKEERHDLESFFEEEIGTKRILSYKIVEAPVANWEVLHGVYGDDLAAEKEFGLGSIEIMKFRENITKPPIQVRHADLERSNNESMYRSKCPACPDGYLLVQRSPITLQLEAGDWCIACGQRFIYEDIEEMRAREEGRK